MGRVFISHVAEDGPDAAAIAALLEKAGFDTWLYERDSVPGVSYLDQVEAGLVGSAALVVILSERTLASSQVNIELVRAHEIERPIVPLVKGLTFDELRRRKPRWAFLLGGAVAVDMSAAPALLADGIRLALAPNATDIGRGPEAQLAHARPAVPGRRGWLLGVGTLVVLLGIVSLTRALRDQPVAAVVPPPVRSPIPAAPPAAPAAEEPAPPTAVARAAPAPLSPAKHVSKKPVRDAPAARPIGPLPTPFSDQEIADARDVVSDYANNTCRAAYAGEGSMYFELTVDGTGRVRKVKATGGLEGTALGDCVKKVAGGIKFSSTERGGVVVFAVSVRS
jgi:hypothetical protein